MKYKICLFFLITLVCSNRLFSQTFNLNIYRFQNSCTKEMSYSMDDPQTRWYLSPEKAILGFTGKSTQIDPHRPKQTNPHRPFQIDPLIPA